MSILFSRLLLFYFNTDVIFSCAQNIKKQRIEKKTIKAKLNDHEMLSRVNNSYGHLMVYMLS